MNNIPYYEEHQDQLSEKFKNQYDFDKGDLYFTIFVIIVVILAFIVG